VALGLVGTPCVPRAGRAVSLGPREVGLQHDAPALRWLVRRGVRAETIVDCPRVQTADRGVQLQWRASGVVEQAGTGV
jgi:hypothetical protein